MAEDSPYKISLEEFTKQSPRLYGQPADPDDPEGEIRPATAFAEVVQPEPPPNPNMIEGMIAGLGRIGAATSADDATSRRVGRMMAIIGSLILLVILIGLGFAFL